MVLVAGAQSGILIFTMFLTLFFFSAFLGVVRYYDLDQVLAFVVTQRPEVYAILAFLVLVFRLGIAISRIYPRLVSFYESVVNLSEKSDKFWPSQGKGGPFNGQQKRQVHTSASPRQPLLGRRDKAPHLVSEMAGGVAVAKTPCPSSARVRVTKISARVSMVPKGHPKSIYHSALLRSRFNPDRILDYLRVKAGAGIVYHLKGISLFTGITHTGSTIKFLLTFSRVCSHLVLTQGAPGLVKFLKACSVTFQQNLGGHRVHDCTSLGARVSRTKQGMPRIIPPQFRIRIRQGDTAAIRLTLTLFNLFRVVSFPGELKLSTITNISTAKTWVFSYLEGLIPLFVRLFVLDRIPMPQIWRIIWTSAKNSVFPIFKGGPGSSGNGGFNSHPLVVLRSLLALYNNRTLWEAFTILVHNFRVYRIRDLMEVLLPLRNLTGALVPDSRGVKYHHLEALPFLGKLGTKDEAAGKIRVFAMVDAWTQWVLYPLHQLIFKILEGVPMDGTFDQTAPLSRVKAIRGLWSLDLSAATDRLPLSLQRSLLGAIIGRESASAWAHLLTGRVYRLSLMDAKPVELKYSVGQPMGALSSWASLAITHHFLVQCAAWSAGFPKWKLYTNYAVLGDDVVIGNRSVALSYLRIMDSLGVGVNTSKSLLSHQGLALEFAKRTIVRGVDVSPVTFKEYFTATRNIGAFIQLMKKTSVSFPRALQALGVGWKVRSWLNKPIGKLSARIRLLILAANVPTSAAEAKSFFELGKAPVTRYMHDTNLVIRQFIDREVSRIFEKLHELAPLSLGGGVSHAWAADLAEGIVPRDLKLSPEGIYLPWSDNDSWYSYWSLADRDTGTSTGAFREVAYGFYYYIEAIRKHQTRDWVRDLNTLMSRCFGLMSGTTNLTFAEVYMEYLDLQEQFLNFSTTVLATQRPREDEVRGILTPSQVRLWKRWSQVLQGSVPLPDPLPKEVDRAEPEQSVPLPSILGETIDTPFDSYHSYVWFQKAGVHEGYDWRFGLWPLYRGISSIDGVRVS